MDKDTLTAIVLCTLLVSYGTYLCFATYLEYKLKMAEVESGKGFNNE